MKKSCCIKGELALSLLAKKLSHGEPIDSLWTMIIEQDLCEDSCVTTTTDSSGTLLPSLSKNSTSTCRLPQQVLPLAKLGMERKVQLKRKNAAERDVHESARRV